MNKRNLKKNKRKIEKDITFLLDTIKFLIDFADSVKNCDVDNFGVDEALKGLDYLSDTLQNRLNSLPNTSIIKSKFALYVKVMQSRIKREKDDIRRTYE